MSANVYWQPVAGKELPTGTPSKFLTQYREAFGEGANLDRDDIPTLRGLIIGWGYKDDNPWHVLLEAVQEHGEIRVWAEY